MPRVRRSVFDVRLLLDTQCWSRVEELKVLPEMKRDEEELDDLKSPPATADEERRVWGGSGANLLFSHLNSPLPWSEEYFDHFSLYWISLNKYTLMETQRLTLLSPCVSD